MGIELRYNGGQAYPNAWDETVAMTGTCATVGPCHLSWRPFRLVLSTSFVDGYGLCSYPHCSRQGGPGNETIIMPAGSTGVLSSLETAGVEINAPGLVSDYRVLDTPPFTMNGTTIGKIWTMV